MMYNKIAFFDDEHEDTFITAVIDTGAVKANHRINSDWGASLFLLTAIRSVWPRLQRYVSPTFIDHAAMLDECGLSSGEALIVRLSGNLYNGGFWIGSPWDLVNDLDGTLFPLALEALRLRKVGMRLYGGEVTTL